MLRVTLKKNQVAMATNVKMNPNLQPNHAFDSVFRLARKNSGLTLRQTAKKMGVSHQHLSNLETGKKSWNSKLQNKFHSVLVGQEKRNRK